MEAPPHHSIVIVVSPLNSLMDDRVARFSSRGLKCTALCREDRAVMQSILHGEYQMVFLSPESMLQDLSLREVLKSEIYQKNH